MKIRFPSPISFSSQGKEVLKSPKNESLACCCCVISQRKNFKEIHTFSFGYNFSLRDNFFFLLTKLQVAQLFAHFTTY